MMRMKKIKHQGGWTFWSLTFVLSVILFVTYIGMKLVPVYSVNNNIRNAMKQSVVGQDLRRVTRGALVAKMKSQLYLDGSHLVLDYKDELDISRGRDKLVIKVSYDRIIPLFFNVSLLLEFRPTLECDFSGRCYELGSRLK